MTKSDTTKCEGCGWVGPHDCAIGTKKDIYRATRQKLILEIEDLLLCYDEPQLETGAIGLLYQACAMLRVNHG